MRSAEKAEAVAATKEGSHSSLAFFCIAIGYV